MKQIRLTNYCQLPLGIVAALIVLAAWSTACTPTPTPPSVSPGATVTDVVSSAPPASATPTLSPRPTTIITLMKATEVPRSYFSLTLSITATATELKVGDTITVTVTVTNAGKLEGHQTYCNLRGWLEDGTPNDYLPNPIVEPGYPGFDMGGINPGDTQRCTFILQAKQPGTVFLEGGYAGKVIFTPDFDRYAGEKSPRLKIHVGPANP
jgi:hypothetical protein